jgi:CRISPR-associated endonuclease Cas1
VTLERLAWLRAMGASLVHLDLDGNVLTHTAPFGYDGYPIRRAQALAVANGLDVEIARDLIRRKLVGQRTNLARLGVDDLAGFDRMQVALETTQTIEEVRLCEAKAASVYWNAWTNVSIRMRPRDVSRVPVAWTRYETRKSTLTNGPRAATNPINSLLNYSHSLLESEARLALLGAGLDPTLGVLHADQRNRDSFALDAMEPVRPAVEAFVLDLLEERVLTSRDFVELPNGVCRVRAPLTHDLALTLPRWRQLMAPVVSHLARAFRDASTRQVSPEAMIRRTISPAVAKPSLTASTLVAIPRKALQPKPYASKAWGAPRAEPLRLTPAVCASCGAPVVKRRRKYCDMCIPAMRVARANEVIAVAREALALQSAKGADPRKAFSHHPGRSHAISEGHRLNREWEQQHGRDPGKVAWYRREVLPGLSRRTLTQIAERTGLSLGACSRIRSGNRTPHPRHWSALLDLAES